MSKVNQLHPVPLFISNERSRLLTCTSRWSTSPTHVWMILMCQIWLVYIYSCFLSHIVKLAGFHKFMDLKLHWLLYYLILTKVALSILQKFIFPLCFFSITLSDSSGKLWSLPTRIFIVASIDCCYWRSSSKDKKVNKLSK